MRMLMQVRIPHDTFNAALKDGSVGAKMDRILDATKPEAVYFTEQDGQRGAVMVIDLADPSQIPAYAEPWFITFEADVEFLSKVRANYIKMEHQNFLSYKYAVIDASEKPEEIFTHVLANAEPFLVKKIRRLFSRIPRARNEAPI